MIRQAAGGEEPFWSVPSGAVEDGELVTEALVREVLEETGLEVVDPGILAFVFQIDNRRPEQLHTSRGPGNGYLATVWTFEVAEYRGTLGPRDPDGLVAEARFLPVVEAIGHLARLEWQSMTVAYLRGEIEPGSLHMQRWHAHGRIEDLGRVAPRQSAASGSRQRSPG
jgi:8-oxo-dGTP diphosphatase